jgi:hypothetical protein
VFSRLYHLATSPALLIMLVFEIGSHSMPVLSWTEILFVLTYIAGMTDAIG